MKTKTIIIKQISTSAYFKISLPDMLSTTSFSTLGECRKSKAPTASFIATFTREPALFAQYNEVKTGLRLPDYVKLHYPELFL
jgi:hypothetical protein